MPCSRLSQKRWLDEVYFHEDIVDKPGVYIFYQTNVGPPRYVGRADTNLYRRIRGRGYRYYRYKHCSKDTETYYWECIYWHRFQEKIDNSRSNGGNHPAKPSGKNIYCLICNK